jgi:hypothetical protein
MRGVAGLARATIAADGAKKWDGLRLRLQVSECFLELLGSRLHERVMEGDDPP